MRALIQRVTEANVSVEGECVGAIEEGLCVLVGITHSDTSAEVAKIAKKIAELKLLRGRGGNDDERRSIADTYEAGEGKGVLLISQFTLYADVRKGKKPSWSHAAPGAVAEPLFNELVEAVRARGITVETGVFGAMMDVQIHNDGPFTILAEA